MLSWSSCSNVKKESCFFPIPQAAECIMRIVEKANAPVIYLSTDAAESETSLLQSLVVSNDRQVPLMKRPEHHSSEKWDALLYRHHVGGDSQVQIQACIHSSVFIQRSTIFVNSNLLVMLFFRSRRCWIRQYAHCQTCSSDHQDPRSQRTSSGYGEAGDRRHTVTSTFARASCPTS
jgi:peptide-O-fucosyltransferase